MTRKYGYTSDADVNTIRWSPDEWEFAGFGSEHFDATCGALAAVAENASKAAAHRIRSACSPRRSMHWPLEAAGGFGRAPQRAGLTVYFSVTDSDDATKVQRASARRL